MKKLLMLALAIVLFLGSNASAFFLNLTPVSKYTDGTSIEPQFTVTYDAWVDGNVLALGFPTASVVVKIPLIDNTFGATHTYNVRTRMSDGRVSDNVVAILSSPLDSRLPGAPVAPLSITQ